MTRGIFQGSLFLYAPGDNAGVRPLSDAHHGRFIGADVLSPGDEHCVVSPCALVAFQQKQHFVRKFCHLSFPFHDLFAPPGKVC